MKQSTLKSNILLVLTALIWGVAFVAQSVGMEYVGPFTFTCVRNILGGFFLIPCIYFMQNSKKKAAIQTADITHPPSDAAPQNKKDLIRGGILCGIALCFASMLQQYGISYTTVGKAGFITSLYIVIVPILGIFLKKKPRLLIWFSVILAVFGLYLLCMTGNFTISTGDFLVLLCAIVFSIHILLIDHFSPKADGVKMSCIQFLTAGILSGAGMLILEKPALSSILAAWMPLLYAGILSCGVGYTLQIIGQKRTDPTVASLILSLESVFSVLAGWILLGQTLNNREMLGCAFVFIGIILAQLPQKEKMHRSITAD